MSHSMTETAALGWPEPDARLLARPPLEVVICEIRTISDTPVILASPQGLALKEAADAAGFPSARLESAQQQALRLQVGLGEQPSPVMESRNVGWQLVHADGSTVATFFPSAVTLQTTSYKSWDDTFRPMLTAVLTAFDTVVRPQIIQRIGLRYVDRLVDPAASSPSAWRNRVAAALLGPIADGLLGDYVINSQQQVELRIKENRHALLRHGPFSDGALRGAISYMLDIDVFDTTTVAFELTDTLTLSDDLNRTALSLFQTALSDSYLTELREGT